MSLAEKKQHLMHIVEDADEKLTGLLIALAKEYNEYDVALTADEVAEIEKRRVAYHANPESANIMEEAIEKIRSKYAQ